MFIHHENDPDGAFLISQLSHQAMAWQLADHWGNRRFRRPSPRAEVVAAVLLHDSGWFDFDQAPSIDDHGRPVTFDRMSVDDHLAIWRDSIYRAGAHSRYSGLLVAAHFHSMLHQKIRDHSDGGNPSDLSLMQEYREEMDEQQSRWTAELSDDPRFEPALEGAGRDANARVLSGCDQISVYLCADLGSPFEVEIPLREGGSEKVVFSQIDAYSWRVRPWPFIGDAVRLHCDAYPLDSLSFASKEDLHGAIRSAVRQRLRFDILTSSRNHG